MPKFLQQRTAKKAGFKNIFLNKAKTAICILDKNDKVKCYPNNSYNRSVVYGATGKTLF